MNNKYNNLIKSFHNIIILRIVVVIIIFIPTLVYYLGFSTSMTLGTSIACILSIIIFLIKFRNIIVQSVHKIVIFGLLLAIFIVFHAVMVGNFNQFDYERCLLSIIPLELVVFCGFFLSKIFLNQNQLLIDRIAFQICWIFMLIGFLSAIGFELPSLGAYSKPVFPFTEPSLYSLAFLPFLMYCTFRSGGFIKILYFSGGFVISIYLQSLTMLVGISIIAILYMRFNGRYIIAIISIITSIIAIDIDYGYYYDRLNFLDNNYNLSALVYLQGWQLMLESLSNSWLLGIGFQQLGVHGTSVEAAEYIREIIKSDLNILDGGFLFSKIISELGLIGAFIILTYIRLTWDAIKNLRIITKGDINTPYILILSNSILLSFSIELFVRGQGYFTGSSVMLVLALTTIFSLKNKKL
jgi:hypothetical protein